MPFDLPNQNEDEIHLREYVTIILKRKRIVIAIFVAALVIGLLVSLSASPMYTAVTRVKVEQKAGNPLEDLYGISRQDPAFFNSQIQIISSLAVMEKVVNIMKLTETYASLFPDKKNKKEDKKPAEANAATGAPEEKPVTEKLAATLLPGLKVERVRDSQILSLSYTSHNPAFSALVCNTMPRAYIEQLLEMKMTNTEYTIDWMEKKAVTEREKLEEAEHALQNYLVAQDIVTIENRITIIPERLSQINTELSQAESKQRELKTIMAQIDRTSVDSLDTIPTIAAETSLQTIRGLIREAEQNMITLSQKYGEKHPLRIQARDTLNELQAKKEAETRNIVQRIRNEMQLAATNQESLNRQLDDIKAEAARLNEKSIQYNILKREIETRRQLYDALVSRIKEQSMTKQIRDVDVYVVEPARTPASPSNQNLPRNLLIALVIGCVGGIGAAFFLEYMDNTISLCEDAEEKTGVKAIVSIPYISGEDGKNPETIVSQHPASSEAESYKTVRTALSLSTPTGFPKTMMVTSVYPSDGKTITCANLAIAIAQADRSVLVVDCDMRRPTLHRVFGKSSRNGFAEILTGQIKKDAAIQETDIPNLHLIPAGTIPPNPSDLLASEQTVKIIKDLGKNYDIVIFDTPPMASVSDGSVLAGYVEKIVLVTRSGVTRYEDVVRVVNNLGATSAKIVGQVVNAVDMSRQRYYYPYYYKYTQYYYAREE
ncbi:MAG: polysaccharide biosynthesis tyrosine autokinase [Thermodesulfobacteriota bacterium]